MKTGMIDRDFTMTGIMCPSGITAPVCADTPAVQEADSYQASLWTCPWGAVMSTLESGLSQPSGSYNSAGE